MAVDLEVAQAPRQHRHEGHADQQEGPAQPLDGSAGEGDQQPGDGGDEVGGGLLEVEGGGEAEPCQDEASVDPLVSAGLARLDSSACSCSCEMTVVSAVL